MARVVTLVLCVAFGLVFLSRSCALTRAGGPIALTHGRIVNGAGADQVTRLLVIADKRIASISLDTDAVSPPSGARIVDVTGLYVAAATFDRSAPTLMDGIRHVWIGQMSVGDPGDVVITRVNPGRVRPGLLPETDAIVAAAVDGVYYTARDLSRRRPPY